MKAVVKWLLENIYLPILFIILTPIITPIASKVFTDNWSEFFTTTPLLIWVILAIILIPWIVFAIHHRIKHLRKENWSPIRLRFEPSGGWETIDTIKYAGVIWNVRVPIQASSFKIKRVLTAHDLDIEIPPRCPNCKTELEPRKSFWWWYVWKCVKCGFRRHNRDSYYEEAERVAKIARSKFGSNQPQTKERQ